MTTPPAPPAPHGEQPGGASRHLQSLNERQKTYLDVPFTIDQDNQSAQARRWHATGERQPGEQWRWITYGIDHPAAEATQVQQQLGRRHVLDAGAGATLAALQRRGLIEVRRVAQDGVAGPVWHTQVRLTRAGRALQPASAEQVPDPSLLPEWLQAALDAVATAPGQTSPRSPSGGWRPAG